MSMWSVWNWYALQCYCMVTFTLKAAASYFYFINKSVAEHFKMRLLQLSGSDALASAWADSAWTTSAIATLSSIIRRTMCLCFLLALWNVCRSIFHVDQLQNGWALSTMRCRHWHWLCSENGWNMNIIVPSIRFILHTMSHCST